MQLEATMETINLNDFLDFSYFSNLKANKNEVAWVNLKANLKNNNYDSNIWLKKSDEIIQLSSFNKENSFFWYQDQIVFSGVRGSSDQKQSDEEKIITHFYILKTDGGEAQKFFTLPLKVLKIEHLIDDKFVVLASSDLRYPNWHEMDKEARLMALKDFSENDGYEEIEDLPWWGNGLGFTNYKRSRLYLYDNKKIGRAHV